MELWCRFRFMTKEGPVVVKFGLPAPDGRAGGPPVVSKLQRTLSPRHSCVKCTEGAAKEAFRDRDCRAKGSFDPVRPAADHTVRVARVERPCSVALTIIICNYIHRWYTYTCLCPGDVVCSLPKVTTFPHYTIPVPSVPVNRHPLVGSMEGGRCLRTAREDVEPHGAGNVGLVGEKAPQRLCFRDAKSVHNGLGTSGGEEVSGQGQALLPQASRGGSRFTAGRPAGILDLADLGS